MADHLFNDFTISCRSAPFKNSMVNEPVGVLAIYEAEADLPRLQA